MPSLVTLNDFDHNWEFFTSRIKQRANRDGSETFVENRSRFSCSDFGCKGCDDWLDFDRHNRNSNISLFGMLYIVYYNSQ